MQNKQIRNTNRYIAFTEETLNLIENGFELACKIYGDCDFDSVKILAANVAAHGRYIAHYHSMAKLIEVPLNNLSFPLVKLTPKGIEAKNHKRFIGVLLHELGHHVEHYHPNKPWSHLKAGKSTHTKPSWCWVCATGWNYFFPELEITPEELAIHTKSIGKQLATFEPNSNPQQMIGLIRAKQRKKTCLRCLTIFHPKRNDAVFCSQRCRTAAHRALEH